MAGWLIKVAQRISPLLALLENEIRGGPLINIDESPLQVLKEPGRKKQRGKGKASKGYADQALDYIGRLYRIEKQIRQEELSSEQAFWAGPSPMH